MANQEMTKHERYALALGGEDVKPDWVPDLTWNGKMTGPIAAFCTTMIASGHPDEEIREVCETWFGGPKTVKPIRRLHDTHAPVIAEKVEELSREMAHIPIAHKAYRLNVLNRMATDLMDRFYQEAGVESPANVEKLTRSVTKVIGMAQEEMEGRNIQAQQNNVYIEAINTVGSEELDSLATTLENTYSKIQSALSGDVPSHVEKTERADDEALEVEFTAEDE